MTVRTDTNHPRHVDRLLQEHFDVQDGRLTIEIGRPGETTNTCLLWCVVRELQQ